MKNTYEEKITELKKRLEVERKSAMEYRNKLREAAENHKVESARILAAYQKVRSEAREAADKVSATQSEIRLTNIAWDEWAKQQQNQRMEALADKQ